jgi:glycosyltransferase involved in cell wall biosynthesis
VESPLKVIHLSAGDSGGAYVFAENLCMGLRKEGLEAKHLVFSGSKENYKFSSFSKLDHFIKNALHACEKLIQVFHEKDSDVRFKFSLGYPGISLKRLKKICAGYDIVHLHWINKGFINIKTLEKLGKPIVWTCHDLWPVSGGCHLSNGCENFHKNCGNCPYLSKPSAHDLSFHIHQKKSRIYKNLNLCFVSPSLWMDKNIWASSLGRDHKHLCINNGVDTTIFKAGESDKSESFTIGFVAANLNDKNKALYRLAEALKDLDETSGIRLLLVGNQKQAFDFEFNVPVEITGSINNTEEMAALYRRMDVLVCTSTLETFPTTLMEAFCCGVTGLGFETGGISEILGKMGVQSIAAYDTEALKHALLNLKNSALNKTEVAEKAKELFGIRQTALSYKNVYLDLLHNKGQ